jgi:hypothetical protein|tara:strand:+ start:7634 stop:7789 length:156 start_codon:yes stop_codon:yes gene_type:complete
MLDFTEDEAREYTPFLVVSYSMRLEAFQLILVSGRGAAVQERTTVLPDACL